MSIHVTIVPHGHRINLRNKHIILNGYLFVFNKDTEEIFKNTLLKLNIHYVQKL